MDRILLPLRSNAGWFTDANSQAALEQRLKNYLVTFDEIAVQDGRYSVTLWNSQTSFELMSPAASIGFPRNSVDYFKAEHEPLLLVGGQVLGQGPAEASYTVDFAPLFTAAGIRDADYVEWLDGDITEESKKQLGKLASIQTSSRIPVPPELESMSAKRRETILTALLIDTAISNAVGIPFSTDFHAGPLISWNNAGVLSRLAPAIRPRIYDEWVLLGLPDFSSASWDEVHKVRESMAGRDYRAMLRRVEADVLAATREELSSDEIVSIIRRGLVNEIVTELIALAPSAKQAALNVGWNLVPLVGAALATISDVREIVQHQQSWVSLLAPARLRA